MAGLEGNIESFKTAEPKTAQEYASGYNQIDLQNQALQRGNIGITKDKLELINQQFGLMNTEMSALSDLPKSDDPNVINQQKIQAAERMSRFAKMTNMPQEAITGMLTELQQAPNVQTWSDNNLRRGMSVQERLNRQYGGNSTVNTGNQLQPGVTASPAAGGGFTQSGPPINIQPPPTQPTVDNAPDSPTFGQPGIIGPQGKAFKAPSINARPSLKGAVAPPEQPANPAQPTPPTALNTPSNFIPTGTPPLYDEGKKFMSEDQALSTQKLTAVKPALLALDLMKDLRSGPGTELWNKAVAGLKANGIIYIDSKNDPTVIYQEVNKYMNDYLSRRGGSTDAARDQLMKSSPDLNSQINPALIKLTKTTIAQDRIEAARPGSFKGNDFQNYGKHRSTFPASMDERAFITDKLTPDEKQELAKEITKMTPQQKQRFVRSLKIFKSTGVGLQ